MKSLGITDQRPCLPARELAAVETDSFVVILTSAEASITQTTDSLQVLFDVGIEGPQMRPNLRHGSVTV